MVVIVCLQYNCISDSVTVIMENRRYKWKKRNPSPSELLNLQITEYVKDFYEESNGVLGYRQMCININREKIDELPHIINVKRVHRIMQILGLKSVIRRKRPDYVKSTPEITAENILRKNWQKFTLPMRFWEKV